MLTRKLILVRTAILAIAALAKCASYASLPLDPTIELATNLSSWVDAPQGELFSHEIDYLTLANKPALRAARARLGIARAQIVETGILPNLQIAVLYPFFVSGPNGTNAFSVGIAQGLKSIILRRNKIGVASNAAAEINA